MESCLLSWVVVFCLFAFIVQSQQQDADNVFHGDVKVVPLPPPPSPPPPSPQPPPQSPPQPPPPPLRKRPPPAPPKNGALARNHSNNHIPHSAHGKLSPPPPPKEKRLNFGKKIGLFFLGIAAILQVCVVTFLVIKRKQLLRAESRY